MYIEIFKGKNVYSKTKYIIHAYSKTKLYLLNKQIELK